MDWVKRLLGSFKQSQHVHVRGGEVASIQEAIGLIDRFIDDKLAYPLEWDDFISWDNSNISAERLRLEIASLEPMFFSSDKETRRQAHLRLVELRNHYGALLGIAPRSIEPREGTGP